MCQHEFEAYGGNEVAMEIARTQDVALGYAEVRGTRNQTMSSREKGGQGDKAARSKQTRTKPAMKRKNKQERVYEKTLEKEQWAK